MDIIKNCFNYVGSKDRIMNNVLSNLDTSKNIFVDLFCGSGIVGANVSRNLNYDIIIMNDACWQVIEIIKEFKALGSEVSLEKIDKFIHDYNLSKDNKEGYLEARKKYNEIVSTGGFNPTLLYTLIAHSFNYNIVFNSKEEYNVPAGTGRSWFNPSLRNKLKKFIDTICEESNLQFTSCKINQNYVDDTFNFLEDKKAFDSVMVYADPPYFCSDASHSRIYGLKWTDAEEVALYNYLDKINEYGGSFLLSNLVCNNGVENKILTSWMGKYNVVEVDVDYSSCCYQKTKQRGKTREVLVKNY